MKILFNLNTTKKLFNNKIIETKFHIKIKFLNIRKILHLIILNFFFLKMEQKIYSLIKD
jgi:hypothetical protein